MRGAIMRYLPFLAALHDVAGVPQLTAFLAVLAVVIAAER
jgi:hypothetical protein